MYIKRKQIDGFPELPKDQLVWKRIRYAEWRDMPQSQKNFYEVKLEKLPSEKQREALTRGQILRHVECAIAQAVIAQRLIEVALKEKHKLSIFDRDYLNKAAACLSTAGMQMRGARTNVQQANVIRYGHKQDKEN